MADSHNTNNPNPNTTQPQTQTPSSMSTGSSKLATQSRMGRDLIQRSWDPSPFSFMQRFLSDMDRLFGDFMGGPIASTTAVPSYGTTASWVPQVDLFQRGTQLVVHADLPGLQREDVRVNVDDGVLSISGERQHQHDHEHGGVYHCERSYGAFQRSIALPEGIEPESVQASFDNGVLEVTMPLPKARAPKGRAIPVGAKPAPGIKH